MNISLIIPNGIGWIYDAVIIFTLCAFPDLCVSVLGLDVYY